MYKANQQSKEQGIERTSKSSGWFSQRISLTDCGLKDIKKKSHDEANYSKSIGSNKISLYSIDNINQAETRGSYSSNMAVYQWEYSEL